MTDPVIAFERGNSSSQDGSTVPAIPKVKSQPKKRNAVPVPPIPEPSNPIFKNSRKKAKTVSKSTVVLRPVKPGEEPPKLTQEELHAATTRRCVQVTRGDHSVLRVVQDAATPLTKSDLDPTLRTPNYKTPMPDSEWKPWWKPRKRPIGYRGSEVAKAHAMAIEESLGIDLGALDDLPRDASGNVVLGPEFADAVVMCIANGIPISRIAMACGMPRSRIDRWIHRDAELKARVDAVKPIGADALADRALLIATEPLQMEDVFESYDENGNLVRRDVKRADAAYARKLAVNGIMMILSKWAPERYGEKVEGGTTESMAARILAARQRVGGQSSR